MAKPNPKLIGGFVVGAIVLLVVGVLAFGGGEFLKPKGKFIMFFQGSLSGLDAGSPVTFRGVKVGTVTSVVIKYDVAKQVLRIPIRIELEAEKIEIVSGERNPTKNIDELVARGLRAQLETVSLVTGQTAINLDFHPGTPLRLVSTEPGIQELPTIPSDIAELKANLTSLMAKISKLPLEQLLAELLNLVKDADAVVKSGGGLIDNVNGQVKPLSDSVVGTTDQANALLGEARARLQLRPGEPVQKLNAVLDDARILVENVNRDLPSIIGPTVKVLTQASVALDLAGSLLKSAQAVISPSSPVIFELVSTLREFKFAAAALKNLAEYLQRNPSAVLTGKR